MSVPREPRSNLHSRGPSMRNNKAILDEAARSVRRTFIGSVAGTLGMLAVIGAAGAYGTSDKVTVQAVSAAMAKLSIKLPASGEQPTKIHQVVVADAAIRIMPQAAAI